MTGQMEYMRPFAEFQRNQEIRFCEDGQQLFFKAGSEGKAAAFFEVTGMASRPVRCKFHAPKSARIHAGIADLTPVLLGGG